MPDDRVVTAGASGSVVRRDSLLKAGYLVALLLVLVPLVDGVTRTWPLRLREETWRFGFLGIVLNALVTPLLGVFLAMVIAAALGHGRTLWVITFVTLAAAVAGLAALASFALDYIQMRANVTDAAMRSFDASGRKAILVGLAGVATAVVLGISGWRTARRMSGVHRGADRVGLL